MKIQNFKRIIKEDFEDKYQSLVEKIGNTVNVFSEDVFRIFSNNITITDNLDMQYKDLTLQVDSTGIPKVTTAFKSTLKSKCQGITVEKVQNTTNGTLFLTSAPFVEWTEFSGLITINHITGLTANNNYTIRLLAKA